MPDSLPAAAYPLFDPASATTVTAPSTSACQAGRPVRADLRFDASNRTLYGQCRFGEPILAL
jgi:hypothetical protein